MLIKSFAMFLLVSAAILFCFARLADSCAPPQFPDRDPCMGVTCPYGQNCTSTRDYYCSSFRCPLVATCSPKSTGVCSKPLPCPSDTTCLDHVDQCTNNGTLCTFKSQCDLTTRPGQCPIGIVITMGECPRPGMGCTVGSDASCPPAQKCCSALSDDRTPASNVCSPVGGPQ